MAIKGSLFDKIKKSVINSTSNINIPEPFNVSPSDQRYLNAYVDDFISSYPRSSFDSKAAYEDAFNESLGSSIDNYIQDALDLGDISSNDADMFEKSLWSYARNKAGLK